jgi:hypothetical protein
VIELTQEEINQAGEDVIQVLKEADWPGGPYAEDEIYALRVIVCNVYHNHGEVQLTEAWLVLCLAALRLSGMRAIELLVAFGPEASDEQLEMVCDLLDPPERVN